MDRGDEGQKMELNFALYEIGTGEQEIYAERLFKRLPPSLDPQDEVQLETLLHLADSLLSRIETADELEAIEELVESQPERWPIPARMVVKLARSKAALMRRPGKLHFSVVVPLYGEHNRLRQPFEHPEGEDLIRQKLRQIKWICRAGASHTFELLFVDDGCPHGSGRIAEQILARDHPNAPARVIHLEDAINRNHPALAGLQSVDESQKGGAVHLGIWEAAAMPSYSYRDHIVAFTDADLSTHLGQLGLLVEALDQPGTLIATGSRRARNSLVVKKENRSARGRLFIYLWKKLLPELAYVDDTQCGFKAIRAEDVAPITRSLVNQGLAFDIELLLSSERLRRRSISQVPIAWIDSDKASNTRSTSTHLSMLRSIVSLSRSLEKRRDGCEDFSRVIESLDEDSWNQAIEQFGPTLSHIDPALDRDYSLIAPSELLALQAT